MSKDEKFRIISSEEIKKSQKDFLEKISKNPEAKKHIEKQKKDIEEWKEKMKHETEKPKGGKDQ